jgi:alpha-galactosidase
MCTNKITELFQVFHFFILSQHHPPYFLPMNRILLSIVFALIFISAVAQQKYYITKAWLFKGGDSIAWAECNYPDRNWNRMDAGISWPNTGNANLRYGWYRYHLNIPKALKGPVRGKGFIKINFGIASEAAQYFFNGRGLGQSGSLPPRFIKADPSKSVEFYVSEDEIRWDTLNIISIRVCSTDSLRSGIVKGPLYYYIPKKLE